MPFFIVFAALTLFPGMAAANSVSSKGADGGDYPAFPVTTAVDDPVLQKQIERGEYLVKVADCLACHTDQASRAKPFSGGLKMSTPFGDLYSPNITPDRETGIGQWSEEDFVRAIREGVRPDGSYYFPVFPYNYFSRMSRDDVRAIKAYLDRIPAVSKQSREAEMDWPFNYRFLQFGWRLLFFEEGEFKQETEKSDRWNRGAFLVEGPGHCALCHSELNVFGVPRQDYYLAGTFVEGWYAPDISARGLRHLSNKSIADIFANNQRPYGGNLGGPMADVEHNSLRYLSYDDMLAIAEYLQSVNSKPPPLEVIGDKPLDAAAGKKLYESSCKVCHTTPATDAPQMNDKSAWQVLLDQRKERLYEVAIKGSGSMPARGGCQQCSDARIAAAVDYMIELALDVR